MSFIDSSDGGSSSSSSATKDNIIRSLRDEVGQQNVSALITRMHKRCFQTCIPTPGASLSSSETQCLQDCASKYLQMLNVVSKQWNQHMNGMSRGGGGSL